MIGNGFIITLLIFLPNILFLLFKPVEIPEDSSKKTGLYNFMTAIEWIGRAGVLILPFFYSFRLINPISLFALFLFIIFLIFYYAGWMRYIIYGRKYKLLFAPLFLNIPVPMAICPVLAFFAGSIILASWPLGVANIFLGVGHIYISYTDFKRIK